MIVFAAGNTVPNENFISMHDSLVTLLEKLDIDAAPLRDASGLAVRTPIDGSLLAHVPMTSAVACGDAIRRAKAAQNDWQLVPAPRRGEFVRRYGNALRDHKDALGMLVTLETGKLLQEGLGEVQEMIDICDFAVGLSRQLHGLTIASERPEHRMLETWHPYGVCGVISAFNFPVAVWAWNAALALVCGNAVVWKPSEKTPLVGMGCSPADAAYDRRVRSQAQRRGAASDRRPHARRVAGRASGRAL